MALESETVETLAAAALQLTSLERATLVDRLMATLDADLEVEEAWATEVERADKPKSKKPLFLCCPVPKSSLS